MPRFCSLQDAVQDAVHDGDVVAMEGFTHLIPFAAGHEVIRQGRRDLTLVRMTPDLIYDQLIGAGCAAKLVFSWGGNPGVGSLHRLRDAVGTRLAAAARARGIQPRRDGERLRRRRGAPAVRGVPRHVRGTSRGSIRISAPSRARSPARRLTAVPALRPDVTRHSRAAGRPRGQRADRGDHRRAEGSGAGCARARSSRSRKSSSGSTTAAPNACILPHWTIDAIAVVPGGAFPSYAYGYYARDNAFYLAWDAISRDRDTFRAWLDEHVMRRGTPERTPACVPDRARRRQQRRAQAPHREPRSTYTPDELMTVAAARCLGNDDVCFVGIGLPSAACNLARLTHAPGITLIYESGTIGARPSVLPLSIGDGELCATALTTVSVPEFFRYWLQSGRISVGFLGAAQIDRFANINTTVIGPYEARRRCGCRVQAARRKWPPPASASSSSCRTRDARSSSGSTS